MLRTFYTEALLTATVFLITHTHTQHTLSLTHRKRAKLSKEKLREAKRLCVRAEKLLYTDLVGSFVSESISNISSFERKKNLGKYSLFFSRYSFSPYSQRRVE